MRNEKEIDVRVIELIKSKDKLLSCDALEENTNAYVCLGHFDLIQVRPVKDNKVQAFARIWSDISAKQKNKQTDRFVNHLYILRDGYGENIQRFWEKKDPFVLVTRIHYRKRKRYSSLKDTLSNYKLAKTVLPEETQEFGDLKFECREEPVYCVFYDSLELGDTVIVFKSRSIMSCLEATKIVASLTQVASVYSYCGFHKALFQEQRGNFLGEKLTTLKENIECGSIRFSIRSLKLADHLFQELKIENVHYVTGTADAISNLDKKNCEDIVQLYKELWKPHYRPESPEPYTSDLAFEDIITRIGIRSENDTRQSRDPEEIMKEAEKQRESLRQVTEQMHRISEVLGDQRADWFLALETYVGSLQMMLNNSVMTDLFLLIWPSVEAFVGRLYYFLVERNQELTASQIVEVETFLNECSILSNDIVSVESQLMQNPKLQAPNVFVPAALLGFYMDFLSKLNVLLEQMEEFQIPKDNYQYIPLISHSISLRPNTQCILDPNADRSGEDAYTGGVPLLVSLPISLMYRPAELALVLCHEYLHYAGEYSRLRNLRTECILKTCVGHILFRWGMDGRIGILPRCATPEEAEAFVRKMIWKELESRKTYDLNYIASLETLLPDVLCVIYMNRQLQSRALTRFYSNDQLQYQATVYAEFYSTSRRAEDETIIWEVLRENMMLYRECYADVAALCCLGLGCADYLIKIYMRELINRGVLLLEKAEIHMRQLEALTAKTAIVCSVLLGENEIIPETELPPFWHDILNKYLWQIRGEEDLSYKFPDGKESMLYKTYEYQPLIRYLKECQLRLQTKLKESNENCSVTAFRNIYRAISSEQVDLNLFYESVRNYRSETLDKLGLL